MIDENKIIENVIVAFIDTSVIDPMYNNYDNMEHQFLALRKHIQNKKLILLTHEVAVREMENHIKEEVSKQIEKYSSVQNSKELVLLKANSKYGFLFGDIDKEKVISEMKKALRAKLKEIGILVIKTGTISVKKLLDDYFCSTPPFGVKNKKSEFPDAIMYQSLLKAVGEEHKLHIIAKDNDWDAVSKDKENLVLHKSLSTFLDFLNKDNISSSAIKTYLSLPLTSERVNLKLKEIVEGIDFKVDGLTYDRKGLSEGFSYDEVELLKAYDINYTIHTIEDINCSDDTEDDVITAIVTIIGFSRVKFNCSSFDEANSAWDSEDHEYKYKEYGTVTEVHEFLFPIRLTISGNYKSSLEITDYTLIQSEDLTSLDNFTLIDREYISDYFDPGFHVERILSCPYCGKDIKVDLISDGTDCVGTYERQMGAENEYNIDVVGICHSCKETYRVTGQVWEYPENCCNYEQDIQINKDE